MVESNFAKGRVVNNCDINEALASILGLRLLTPAHIYHINLNGERLVMSLETGHLLSFIDNGEDDLAFEFLIDAHTNKVIQT